jgi:hypothetical protein
MLPWRDRGAGVGEGSQSSSMCRDFCDSIVTSSGLVDTPTVPSLCSSPVYSLRADDATGGRAGSGEESFPGSTRRPLSNIDDEARLLESTLASIRLDARRIKSVLSRSTLALSQLRLDSVLLRPPMPSPLPLPLPLPVPVPALVEERPSVPDLRDRSSLAPRRCCKLAPEPTPAPEAEDSRSTLPTPSKNPVIVRTSSSLTLNISLKSPPTSFHNPTRSTSLFGLASETSESMSRSSARFVAERSIPLTCSENRTTACALRKTSGTVAVVVSPMSGWRDSSASNIASDSSISRRCSSAFSSSGREGVPRGRVRGEP